MRPQNTSGHNAVHTIKFYVTHFITQMLQNATFWSCFSVPMSEAFDMQEFITGIIYSDKQDISSSVYVDCNTLPFLTSL